MKPAGTPPTVITGGAEMARRLIGIMAAEASITRDKAVPETPRSRDIKAKRVGTGGSGYRKSGNFNEHRQFR
jgi:hypothetical protein